MIIIKTRKYEKATYNSYDKEYFCTNGIKTAMIQIASDRENNDLAIYTPIEIIDVFDTREK